MIYPKPFWDNRSENLTHPIDDLKRRFIAAAPSTKMTDIFPIMPVWGLRPPGMKIVPPDMICPNCGKELERGHVFRAGFEGDNNRTIPPTIGRGQYCDHIPDPDK